MINKERLAELLGYLYDMKGIQCSLHELDGREVYTAKARSGYCDLIVASPGGYQRCLSCDRQGIDTAVAQKTPHQYRCHAGAIDTVVPVLLGGEPTLVILFGQVLDDSPVQEQWEKARDAVSWYPDQQKLQQAFFQLPRMSPRELKACYELVNACVSETKLERLTSLDAPERAQQLELYIANHYSEALSLAQVARAMNLSPSRLCALAASIAPGMTVGRMLASRRVEAAKALLADKTVSIREVAGRVGIPDYNYFTKVFKKATGQTPSAWRASN